MRALRRACVVRVMVPPPPGSGPTPFAYFFAHNSHRTERHPAPAGQRGVPFYRAWVCVYMYGPGGGPQAGGGGHWGPQSLGLLERVHGLLAGRPGGRYVLGRAQKICREHRCVLYRSRECRIKRVQGSTWAGAPYLFLTCRTFIYFAAKSPPPALTSRSSRRLYWVVRLSSIRDGNVSNRATTKYPLPAPSVISATSTAPWGEFLQKMARSATPSCFFLFTNFSNGSPPCIESLFFSTNKTNHKV